MRATGSEQTRKCRKLATGTVASTPRFTHLSLHLPCSFHNHASRAGCSTYHFSACPTMAISLLGGTITT